MTKDTPTPLTNALADGISVRRNSRGFYVPEDRIDAIDLARTLERDLSECRAVLLELVACKDLHDRIDALDWSLYTFADAERTNELQAEYDRRISLAWSAARADAIGKGRESHVSQWRDLRAVGGQAVCDTG